MHAYGRVLKILGVILTAAWLTSTAAASEGLGRECTLTVPLGMRVSPIAASSLEQWLAEAIRQRVGELKEQVDRLVHRLEELRDSEEYHRAREQAQRLAEEIVRLRDLVRAWIQEELAPGLERELDELLDRLRRLWEKDGDENAPVPT